MPLGAADVGQVGLLGHVGRGVVAGEGVLRHEQPDHEDEPRHSERRLVLELGEDERCRGVVAGDEEQHHRDGEHPQDVPPGADVRKEGDDPYPEAVEEPMGDEHAGVDGQYPAGGVGEVRRQVQEDGEEGGEPEVDAGGDGDLAQQVEPAREPAPGGGVVLGQLGRPVVEAAGGRVGRCDLGHAEPDDRRKDADDDPAPHDDHGAAVGHAEVVEGEAPRQNRDDRERHREVGEAAHPPAELLRVAQLVELGGVVVEDGRAPQWFRCRGH